MSGETLRVLLVTAREETRNQVGKLLHENIGEHRFYWVSQSELAGARAQELVPHLIIVDDRLNGTDPVTLITQLVSRVPSSAHLALVEEGAMDHARRAMLAGARGFVTKPVRAGDLLTTLQQIFRQQRHRESDGERPVAADGRVVVFCAPRGGTGRTTLAINSAIALHKESGQRVALIDADFGAPALDVALNVQSGRTLIDLLPRLSQLDEALVSGVMATHTSGVNVMLAPAPWNEPRTVSLPQIQQILVKLRQMFDWVVVDLGLQLEEAAFGFLDGADRIVVSVLPEMVGLRNTRLMLEQLLDRGYPGEKIWLVLNRATMAGGISISDIEKHLHLSVRLSIPDDQPLVTHSTNRGVPVSLSHTGSALARAYRQLANELAHGPVQVNGAGKRTGQGLVTRLRRGFRSTTFN